MWKFWERKKRFGKGQRTVVGVSSEDEAGLDNRLFMLNNKTLYAALILLLGVLLSGIWFGARLDSRKARVVTLMTSSAQPTPTPEIIPTTFIQALRFASQEYVVDYKHLLCIRVMEMGRRNLEMGIGGGRRNSAIEKKHPYFSQAYWAAYLIAKRQREFAASKGLQVDYNRYRYPFIAYVCFKWAPTNKAGKNMWRTYYWNTKGDKNSKNDTGVATAYYHYSAKRLEKIINKKTQRMYGKVW